MRTYSDPEAFPRIRKLPPYVFVVTHQLKDAALKRGVDVIDLSMGNPDVAPPEQVIEALKRAVGEPGNHRYLDARGIEPFRRAAAAWYRRKFAVELDPEREVIATLGAKEGIGHLLLATI